MKIADRLDLLDVSLQQPRVTNLLPSPLFPPRDIFSDRQRMVSLHILILPMAASFRTLRILENTVRSEKEDKNSKNPFLENKIHFWNVVWYRRLNLL
jgi:hypothetical protein